MSVAAPSATKRRIGAENSETRALIIEATELVIREEGYAAASTRRVALRAGLKPSLVICGLPWILARRSSAKARASSVVRFATRYAGTSFVTASMATHE